MATSNWNSTDYAVSRAIAELHQDHNFITYNMIAKHIGVTKTTVYRSMKHLMENNLVVIEGGSKKVGGYKYKYVGER